MYLTNCPECTTELTGIACTNTTCSVATARRKTGCVIINKEPYSSTHISDVDLHLNSWD
jgi:hypothetical protein